MEKKEDRRIAMTKRLLKAALIELLKEQDIYHISIRELCERADVNRTTFYKYYGSQFDLLTDMEKDMLDFIAKAIERIARAHADGRCAAHTQRIDRLPDIAHIRKMQRFHLAGQQRLIQNFQTRPVR